MNSPDTDIVEESLEDTLRSAFAEHTQEADPTPDADPQPEASTEDTEAPAGRERDEHGRFKPKEVSAEAGAAEAVAPSKETGAGDQPVDPATITPDPYGLAPQYAGPAIKDKWAELPAAVREEIVKRDREVHQQFTRFDDERNVGKQFRTTVAPYEPLIKSLGAEPMQAIGYLLQTDYALRTAQPAARKEMFLKAARDYGIELGGANDGTGAPEIIPQLEPLQQRIDRLERERNADIASRREQDDAQVAQSIEAFASDPGNAYFERVKPYMAALLQSGQASDLKEAYDKAVWADPETRALHLSAQRADEDRKRTAEAAEMAARARRASPSVTGAPGSAVPPQLNGSASNSVEDDLRAAFREHAGRA